MKDMFSSVSPKGQVTIPAEIRRLLGVGPRDKVAFRVDDGKVRIMPARYNVESLYGSVMPLKRPEDFKELRRRAKEEHTQRVISKMHQAE